MFAYLFSFPINVLSGKNNVTHKQEIKATHVTLMQRKF